MIRAHVGPRPPIGGGLVVNTASPQAAGLFAWLPVVGPVAARVPDRSGFWATPTVSGVTVVPDPVVGSALSFSSGSIALGTTKPTDAGAFSVAFWAKPTTTTPVGMFDLAPSQGNYVRNYSSGHVTVNGDPDCNLNLPTAGIWYHLVLVFSRQSGAWNRIEYYRDGGLISTTNGTGVVTYNFSAPVLGNINGGGAGYYAGSMADFRIYNRGLGAAEVYQLWAPQSRWNLYGQRVARRQPGAAAIWPGIGSGVIGGSIGIGRAA